MKWLIALLTSLMKSPKAAPPRKVRRICPTGCVAGRFYFGHGDDDWRVCPGCAGQGYVEQLVINVERMYLSMSQTKFKAAAKPKRKPTK